MDAWDRSCDWILYRCRRDVTRVTIRLRNDRPAVDELIAIRRILPQFQNVAPLELRRIIGSAGSVALGVMPTQDARELIATGTRHGLDMVAEDASYVSYLPVNRTSQTAWIIEDDEKADAIVQEMFAAGVPVENAQA